MAKKVIPYMTKNNLKHYMGIMLSKRMLQEGGERTTVSQLVREMAEYCDLSTDYINGLRQNMGQPSVAVALKICEFIGCSVEEMFQLVPNPAYDKYLATGEANTREARKLMKKEGLLESERVQDSDG
jgi:transcriptional regulator with XRE-family HTH domain